jgi:tRNA threonylcarbamoyladenosine biosynthesis protein TsaB
VNNAIVHGQMNVLVLDTSTSRAAIGLKVRSGKVYAKATDGTQKHGRDLVPSVAELLAGAGLEARDIEVIGIGLGPGSYTGLRVGVTAAKTLAYVTGAALVGLDSLDAVACNAPDTVRRVSVIADAQRGDVYSAEFARGDAGEPLECIRPCQIEPLASWVSRLEPGMLVLGPGLDSTVIQRVVSSEFLAADARMNYPDGGRLITLLDREWATGRRENAWLVEPRYLRRSAAEEKWDSRKGGGLG